MTKKTDENKAKYTTEKPTKSEPVKTLELPRCAHCNAPFVPARYQQRYCKDAHRQQAFQRKKKKERDEK